MATFKIGVILTITFGIAFSVNTDDEHKRFLLYNEPVLDLGGELNQLKTQVLEQQRLIQDFQNTTASLNNAVRVLTSEVQTLKIDNAQQRATDERGGAVYVRWGKNLCPATAEVIYKGFAAGKHWRHNGDGSDTLCLPTDPTWARYVDGIQYWGAFIYGAEYNTNDKQQIFHSAAFNEDLPCVVCQSTNSRQLMIPGRNNCYGNWTMEYQGYLMAANQDTSSHNHICVDQDPDFVQGGTGNNDQHLLYLVEAICGSLRCPPYVNGRELACVVCSK